MEYENYKFQKFQCVLYVLRLFVFHILNFFFNGASEQFVMQMKFHAYRWLTRLASVVLDL